MTDFNIFDDDDFEETASPPLQTTDSAIPGFDDDLDQLRDKTTRTSSTYDEMDMSLDDLDSGGQLDFSLSHFTTSQRLILLALLMLDIVAIGFGLLILLGRI